MLPFCSFLVIIENKPCYDISFLCRFEYVDGKYLNKWVFMDFNNTSERDYKNLCEAFRQVGYQVKILIPSKIGDGTK